MCSVTSSAGLSAKLWLNMKNCFKLSTLNLRINCYNYQKGSLISMNALDICDELLIYYQSNHNWIFSWCPLLLITPNQKDKNWKKWSKLKNM